MGWSNPPPRRAYRNRTREGSLTESADSPAEFWADPSGDAAAERSLDLLNAIGDGLYRLDGEWRFVGINDAVVPLTGYSREALNGEHVSTLLCDADGERVEPAEMPLSRMTEGKSITGADVFEVEAADG